MHTPSFEFEPDVAAADGQRRWWSYSFGASAAVHVCLLSTFAAVWLSDEVGDEATTIETRWTALQHDVPLVQIDVPSEAPATVETAVGVGEADPSLFSNRRVKRAETVATPHARPALSPNAFGEAWPAADLGGEAAYVSAAGASRNGSGDGNGTGGAFFGAVPTGERFVYVIDCSGSMNKPHRSEAGTRFRRLKLELLGSIGAMTPNQKFFVIFFNDHAIPMPANGMVSAVQDNQQRYLEWVARARAVGETDPRDALLLALRMRPDVVYFLTDGSFSPKIRRDLFKLKQNGALIHTFALGNADAQYLLRTIAEANGGEYHFIP